MNYPDLAERLQRLGFRCARSNPSAALWVNPDNGASITIEVRGERELGVAEVLKVLEALGISWQELENA